MNENNEDGSCSGSCDRHKMGWCHKMYFLGCPNCHKKEYLSLGYERDLYRTPKLPKAKHHLIPFFKRTKKMGFIKEKPLS